MMEPAPAARRFTNLLDDQAAGLACVRCRASYRAPGAPPRAVVGHSITGSPVFACAGRGKTCAYWPDTGRFSGGVT